jgi:hypothetical protein
VCFHVRSCALFLLIYN